MGNDSQHENKFIQMTDENTEMQEDVNRRNDEAYQNMMNNARRKDDNYWDINHPVVKTILIILFIIALLGTIYYVFAWFQSK